MADSDALVVVEDWISEHYFTSDAKNESFHKRVLDRRKAWDNAQQDHIETTRSRYLAAHTSVLAQLSALYPTAASGDTSARRTLVDEDAQSAAISECYRQVRQVLGYETGEFRVEHDGPIRRYNTTGVTTQAPFAIVDAVPVQTVDDLFDKDAVTLLEPWRVDEKTEICSSGRAVSTLFVDEDGPDFVLIMAGRWMVIGERRRWPEGRYLAIDLQTVIERNATKRAGEVDKTLVCLDAQSLAPDAGGEIWWSATLEDSVKHTVGVSQDLREGVRTSIEIIANEVVRRRRDKGLDALPQSQAQQLAMQSLRFLYRILFLLYAEASPELGVLPVGAPEYEQGYSLDRLRELVQVPLTSSRELDGTHLFDSLAVLFRLVDRGHRPTNPERPDDDAEVRGLDFHSLRADLFLPKATGLIDQVKLGNHAVQQVLSRLLLSKQQRGKERGYISYVELGINQLGAVYEGLMSYTGFFADTELFEVAHAGNPEKGSWVVPVDRADHIDEKDFVRAEDPDTGELRPRRYSRGEFVFRLSGRERQRSASYYTPEVLTTFVVQQALAELLDQNGQRTGADEILDLTICEPALGSGAFAIEAVRQLAEQYLTRKQAELGRKIDPEQYPAELQRVKASIALHQVYGVDLNATAVEFAEITLWLDTMAKDLDAPWFGLRLRRGNSLVGARHAVYTTAQLKDKSWLVTPPMDVPLTGIAQRVRADSHEPTEAGGRIPHWLVPAKGWGSTADTKQAKELAPERVAEVKKWRSRVTGKPTSKQIQTLVDIGYQAEELWALAYRRLRVAEQQTRREIGLWGQQPPVERTGERRYVTREQIEASLRDRDGAYRRLRRVMDAWCALWYWPLTGEDVEPPSLAEWIDACTGLLGRQSSKERTLADKGAMPLAPGDPWRELADQEHFVISGAGARRVDEVLAEHPWLSVCEQVAAQQGFFHWQLDFATVFGRGGFDLQLGNPPWVRPRGDEDALLAEGDPWWQLILKPSEAKRTRHRELTLDIPGIREEVLDGSSEIVALAGYLGSPVNYPVLEGLQPDLYRCFMSQVWEHGSHRGIEALVHPETHFTDEKAGLLRAACYPRLRRHWQFVNELKLFAEIHHLVTFGVHVYGSPRPVGFDQASGLYRPDTVTGSYRHDGSGPEPGFKVDGHWDTRPHAARIQRVDDHVLETWRDLLETPDTPVHQTRMVYTVNREVAEVLERITSAHRLRDMELLFSPGWHERNDRKKGYFELRWGVPPGWAEAILQGPHLHVANPAFKQPNPTLKSNEDWSPIDLEHLAPDAIPATAYKPVGDRQRYDRDYTHWTNPDGTLDAARNHYRIAWRAMAANANERTLISAIIPPGAAHIHGVSSALAGPLGQPAGAESLVTAGAVCSTLLADFLIRAVPKSALTLDALSRLPLPPLDHPLIPSLVLRTLRLNCLTTAYADLWQDCWNQEFTGDSWTTTEHVSAPLGAVSPDWTPNTPLRRDADRRQALVEIDALVALMLGISADELCTVYRTQFAVLWGYDHGKYTFDANGRIVPNEVLQAWRKQGDRISQEDRTATNQAHWTYSYELPFTNYDREADMRHAYAAFESRLTGLRGQP